MQISKNHEKKKNDPLHIYKIIKTTEVMMFDGNGGMTVNEMAEKLNISPKYLSKLYKEKRGF